MAVLKLMPWLLLMLNAASHAVGRRGTGLSTPKIDTHVHIYPDFYKEASIAAGQVPGPNGNSYQPEWSVEEHLAFMDRDNIEKAYVSCAGPGTVLIPDDVAAGVALTQKMNNFTADMKRTYPTRFGFFASLPLPFINESLIELDRAFMELDADGIVFLSNHYGLYGGDPRMAPIYEKLNERGAVIFIHPNFPCPVKAPTDVYGNDRLDYVEPLSHTYASQTLEYLLDTTRTVADLILTGTAATYSSVKWIVPHCGSALPSMIDRFISISRLAGPKYDADRPAVAYDFQNATALLQKHFWFDLAGFSMNLQIRNMVAWGFGADKFTYGSDVPFTNFNASVFLTGELNATLPTLFNEDEITSIFRGNALGLLGGS